jgi:hypothetical protein
MGVRFNSKKTSSLLAAATLISGAIAYANGATSGGEEPRALALSIEQAPVLETVVPATTVARATLPEQKQKPATAVKTTTTTVASLRLESVDQRKAQSSAAVIVEESTSVVTTTTAPIDFGECAQWRDLALEVGWPAEQWDRLNYVIWRESRCIPSVHNKNDPASGSRGLMQINGFWCRKNSNTPRGYLQDNGVLQTCEDLFDPRTNLTAGLVIWKYGVDKRKCGWGPWSTRKSKWC